MICIFHKWGKWEDAGHIDETTNAYGLVFRGLVFKQTRRCSKCNRVQERAE